MGRNNLYADLGMFRRTFSQTTAYDSADATEIERALETASRDVDGELDRHAYELVATRYFDGKGRPYIWIPDLLSVTSIKLDEDGDRTFELTLSASTDYRLLRKFHDDEEGALPKTYLELDGINGQRSILPCQARLVEISGTWGYTNATEAVAGTGTLADASTTALTTSASDVLEVGQTLKIESEQVYVQVGSGTAYTVERGVNGTTPAGHAAQTMRRYVYHPDIRDAALKIAARAWERRKSQYGNVLSNEVSGTYTVFRGGMDAEVKEMLEPHKRVSA